jgi:hypothetical protein
MTPNQREQSSPGPGQRRTKEENVKADQLYKHLISGNVKVEDVDDFFV